MSIAVRRAIAVLYLLTNISELIKQAKAIVLAMTNNAYFTSPMPSLNAVTAAITGLDLAEVLARGKGAGTAQARDLQKAILLKLLRELQFYVQGIADGAATQDLAEAIITSAGMKLKKVTGRQKNHDEVRHGSTSGAVVLIATVLAAPRAAYFWQWSTDQKSWTSLPVAQVAKSSVSGLTPATTYYFRYHTVSRKTGTSDLSQIMSILVK